MPGTGSALRSRPAGTRRPPRAARRVGYVVAALVNAALLYAVNRWPGWDAVGFLTEDTTAVLGLVNASLVVGVVANAGYALRDPLWVRALGDVLTTSVGLAAMVRIWQVFPFDVEPSGGAELAVRILLGVGIVGSVIGIVAALVRLVRAAVYPQRVPPP